jgi:PAS domain S-box-containing protein
MRRLTNHLKTFAVFYAVVGASVALTYFASWKTRQLIQARESNRERSLRLEQVEFINGYVRRYNMILDEARSLVNLSAGFGQVAWDRYIRGLEWPRRYPGFLELGYAPQQQLSPDQFPSFPVRWLSGSLEDSMQTLDSDLAAESRRRAALIATLRSNVVTGTPLVPVDKKGRQGHVIFAPLGNLPSGEGIRDLKNEVYPGAIFATLDPAILGEEIASHWTNRALTLIPLNGVRRSGGNFDRIITATSIGVPLRFGASLTPAFEAGAPHELPKAILAGGLAFSALLSSLVFLQTLSSQRIKLTLDELRRAEAQAEESRLLLASITQNLSEALFRVSGDEFVFANPACARLFGFDSAADALFKTPFRNLMANPANLEELQREAVEHGGVSQREIEFLRPNGTRFWGMISLSSNETRPGENRFLDGVVADITHRKRAAEETRFLTKNLEQRVADRTAELRRVNEQLRAGEARLRESEERLSKAFRLNPALFSIARLDDGRFVDVNDAFLMALGKPREDVIGKSSQDLGMWLESEDRRGFFSELQARGYIYNRESRFRGKEGQIRTVLHSAELIELKEVPCILSVGLDITDRKKAEIELRTALAREKELVELKSGFVSMVSHEFRTPLGVIVSSAEILTRYYDRLGPERRLGQLEAINAAASRMARLIQDILLLGRVESGRLRASASLFDPAFLCRSIASEIASATANRCPIHCEMPQDPRKDARGDAELLRTILDNLLSNAVKYSPSGETITLRMRQEDGEAIFEIRDRGPGIPSADQPRLFEAFQRGSNVGNIPGSGLGLSIARRCAELSGGNITFESNEQAGTTFTFRVPLFRSAPESLPSTHEENPPD